MKAVIMAGGAGTRLRPVSAGCPKPMVEILDKPVLEHILHLLKGLGIEEVCMTLGYMPQAIQDYFQDGASWGLYIQYRVEEMPLGTAGGVKACADFIGQEDFLVISGDAACDLDLRPCLKAHGEKGAEATLVLYAHPDPVEYGLVLTDEAGRIQGFVEKPAWEQVFTNFINTGIYILSPSVLQDILDDGPFDFSKDLFPKLLMEKRALYGIPATGYWCDIGSPAAYLDCVQAALGGKYQVEIPSPVLRKNVWAASPVPEGVRILPPVYIGPDVTLEPGARLGPYTAVHKGSRIGAGAKIKYSLVDGGQVGPSCEVTGAYIGRNAKLGAGAELMEGCVIGHDAVVGDGALILSHVRIWPEKEVPAGTRQSKNLVAASRGESLTFSQPGLLDGEDLAQLDPEACFALGAALGEGLVGLGHTGGEGARLVANAIACGVWAQGGSTLEYDASFEAAAAFGGAYFKLPAALFVRQDQTGLSIHCFGPDGSPLSREEERKVERAIALGDFAPVEVYQVGRSNKALGILDAYSAAASNKAVQNLAASAPITLSVPKEGAACQTLRKALWDLGCRLVPEQDGVPHLEVSPDGLSLSLRDEGGRQVGWEMIQAMLAIAEFENASGELAVPYDAPAVLDRIAETYGLHVLRLDRDGEQTKNLYMSQSFFRDGVFAGARLCSAVAWREETFSELVDKVPEFYTVQGISL